MTLLHQLNDEVETGLTSLCIGGGQAIAAVVSKYKIRKQVITTVLITCWYNLFYLFMDLLGNISHLMV